MVGLMTPESEKPEIKRNAKGQLMPGSANLNPAGRPKGRNWISTLAELAETKVRGGGGATRAEIILKKLLEEAESGNLVATNTILDRLSGKAIQRSSIDHTSGGEPLNASISFIDPINTIDITPPQNAPEE